MSIPENIELEDISDFKGTTLNHVPADLPDTLPVLPLSNNVIFPSTITPVAIGKKKSIAAVDAATRGNKMLFATAMKSANQENKEDSLTNFYSIGTVVLVLKMLKMPDGTLRILVQGTSKAVINEVLGTEPYITAKITKIEETATKTKEIEALMRNTSDLINRIVNMVSYLPEELQSATMSIEDPLMLVYLISTLFRMKVEDKQRILEYKSVVDKYKRLLSILNHEIEILEIGGKIQSTVQQEMSKSQREYFLREQMKAIKQELGEVDENQAEINEISKKLEAKNLPDEARKEAERELLRLGRIPSISPEHQVIRSYLDWIIDLPWNESTKDNLDLERARKILDEDHYDLKKIKERIIEYLAVRKLKNDMRGPILCFIGPPGVGKTSLGQSIARALGRKFIRMSFGGMHDESEIRGHRRTYIGAMPGRIIQGIRRAGSKNPVFMLDEIDKIGTDFRDDPSSALLEVLDPAQNNNFRDNYLDLPFDLSQVLFITTGNVLQTIQPALRDRMEVLNLSGYTTEEKLHIAMNYLIPRQIEENGLTSKNIAFSKDAIISIINNYTHESGVRNLEREIGTICRKIAYKVASNNKNLRKINPKNLREYLGPQKIFSEVAMRTSQPGVVTGLAWTQSGGDILFIEALVLPGNRQLILTGQLGSVMQESARAALSCIRSISKSLKIKPDFIDKYDIHLHVPAGAIPKDGPSAGITMAVAIASALTKRPVNKEIAMTGEITISGLVLPVGGIKEKVLAAKRAGLKKIILPQKNKQDVEEIDKNLIKGIEFIYVNKIIDVVNASLIKKDKSVSKERKIRKSVKGKKSGVRS